MLMHVASVSTLNAQPRKVSLMCFIGANEALWPVQLSFHETMGASHSETRFPALSSKDVVG